MTKRTQGKEKDTKRPKSARDKRLSTLNKIEQKRDSILVTYVLSDRMGTAGAQIASDALRPMYEHLQKSCPSGTKRVDLFLYSRGGRLETPWPMVCMLREHCEELNVLVPFRAHSAATMIALGADHIVVGKKGELGSIDPQIEKRMEAPGQTEVREQVNVEDVMSYITFLKDRAGLTDQAALSDAVGALASKLDPQFIGAIYRAHTHIRLVAAKLLRARKEPLEEQRINLIVDSLAEKMYFHGHAIGRKEAIEIGLPVEEPDPEIEDLMWTLYLAYERLLKLDQPIDPVAALPEGQDEHAEPVILGAIESERLLHIFEGEWKLRHVRQMPPQLNIAVNVNVPLPPGVQPQQLPPALQAAVQQALQGLQVQAMEAVREALERQAPIQRTEGRLHNASWRDATQRGI